MAEDAYGRDEQQYEVSYAPPFAVPLDEKARGRWFIAQTEKGNVGVVWTDDDGGLGFIPADVQKAPAALGVIDEFQLYLRAATKAGLTATRAFDLSDGRGGFTASQIQEGKLEGVYEVLEDLNSVDVITAAAGEPADDIAVLDEDTLAVTADDAERAVALILSNVDDVYVREDGAWVPAQDGDERVDGLEWIDVVPQFIEVWDDIAQAEDFELLTDELGRFRI